MQTVETTTTNQNNTNIELSSGIMQVLRNDWRNTGGEFDAYWFGYDALKDRLHEMGIVATFKDLKKEIKALASVGKVELRPTYDDEYKLCGRGWFSCD